MVATFCVYGVELHITTSRFQYQVVWFAPCVFMFLWIVASFFLCESPRWLFLSHQDQEAVKTLIRLRCLPFDHPRVQQELQSIRESLQSETEACEVDDHSPSKIISIARETFTVLSNLRRLQQALILYALPQLSGGNSVTNYFIPILEIVGLAGNSTRNLFLNGMYTLSKFFFSLFASFFFIDALGRRNSLFVGVALQLISDIYLAVYIKAQQDDPISYGASEAALASIFIHSFGYTIGKTQESWSSWIRSRLTPVHRPSHSPIRLLWGVVAQPNPIIWGRTVTDFPLAISLCYDVCLAVTPVTNQ